MAAVRRRNMRAAGGRRRQRGSCGVDATGPLVAPALELGSGLAMVHRQMLRIALIGAGHMAGRHLDALRRVATPHQLVGVCDIRAEAAQELAQRARTTAYTSVP